MSIIENWRVLRAVGALGASLAFLLPSVSQAENAASQSIAGWRKTGQLVVRQRAGLSPDALERTLQRHGAHGVKVIPSIAATIVRMPEAELQHVEKALRLSGLFKSVERDYMAGTADDPSDPLFATQWGLPRTAVPLAWPLSTGSPDVKVAVLDTGVEFGHPDLAGQLVGGYDFINDDADPSDDHGHGTRMTGIIAALYNNAMGVAGIAPDTAVIPVKVLDSQGYGPYSAVASGITFAVDQGARVINLSLVGAAPSSLLQDAVDYATANGVVTVAAAGNYGSGTPVYPAASEGAVAVSATDASDQRPYFSNYGAWISLAAPGVDVVTTTLGGTYSASTGTSPAAAFGSGVFALLLAAEPTLSRQEAIARVEAGATDLGSGGWDPYFGWGRVDAYAALTGETGAPRPDETNPTVSLLSPANGSLLSGFVPVDVAANDDVAIARVDLFVDNRIHATETNSPYSFVLDASEFAAGKHKLRAYAYDTSGKYAKTKRCKVFFTPGVGLLVKRAVANSEKAVITAIFSLPAGVTFDPNNDALSVTLTSATGLVFSATAEAGDMEGSIGSKIKATVVPAVPAEGSVNLIARQGSGSPPVYALKVKATKLEGMGAIEELMDLTVQVGDSILSQSLTFRQKNTRFLYP